MKFLMQCVAWGGMSSGACQFEQAWRIRIRTFESRTPPKDRLKLLKFISCLGYVMPPPRQGTGLPAEMNVQLGRGMGDARKLFCQPACLSGVFQSHESAFLRTKTPGKFVMPCSPRRVWLAILLEISHEFQVCHNCLKPNGLTITVQMPK